MSVGLIIPALDEEESIGLVLGGIDRELVDEVTVGDNGSRDRTAARARAAGARVVCEKRRGYGSACLKAVAASPRTDVLVFMDGDGSDDPSEIPLLLEPLVSEGADLVIGSRVLGDGGHRVLTPVQVFGNTLTCALVRLFWGVHTTDLGPFRVIRRSTYDALEMADPDFGWTIEMQVKAAQHSWRVREVAVHPLPRRAGRSKVSGTWKGSFLAGKRILGYVLEAKARELVAARRRRGRPGRSETLVVFARFPEAGRAKTRLVPVLGPQGAADCQRRLTEHAVGEARRLVQRRGVALEIHHEGGDSRRMRDWLGTGLCFRAQTGEDLGDRMQSSFAAAFERADRAVIMGSDCPGLTADVLEQAFASLSRHDLVLGPARDGGYYLIGLRGELPPLFSGPTWGTGSVLAQTLAIARARGLSVHLLEPLSDVDRPEDLREAWQVLASDFSCRGRVEGSRC